MTVWNPLEWGERAKSALEALATIMKTLTQLGERIILIDDAIGQIQTDLRAVKGAWETDPRSVTDLQKSVESLRATVQERDLTISGLHSDIDRLSAEHGRVAHPGGAACKLCGCTLYIGPRNDP